MINGTANKKYMTEEKSIAEMVKDAGGFTPEISVKYQKRKREAREEINYLSLLFLLNRAQTAMQLFECSKTVRKT